MRSTFGAWMLDASQLDDDGTFWIAEHFSGAGMEAETAVRWRRGPDPEAQTCFSPDRSTSGGATQRVFPSEQKSPNGGRQQVLPGLRPRRLPGLPLLSPRRNQQTYKVRKSPRCVQRTRVQPLISSSVWFLCSRFDLNTGRTSALVMAGSRYHNLAYLFPNSKTYFKFAVDESGLWVIFAASAGDGVMAAKLGEETFSVEAVVNTRYPSAKAGNAFLICGVLYFTDDADRKVTHAFDLHEERPENVDFDLRPAGGVLAMVSYYPTRRRLYMWDNSSVKACKVNLA